MAPIYERDLIWAGVLGFYFTIEENLMFLKTLEEHRLEKLAQFK